MSWSIDPLVMRPMKEYEAKWCKECNQSPPDIGWRRKQGGVDAGASFCQTGSV